MFRLLRRLLLLLLLVVIGAAVWAFLRFPDPEYQLSELVFRRRFHRYDALITDAARRNGVDPALVKAVVWRESRFRPDKQGGAGERGLMQIGAAAASEWARSERAEGFQPERLFEPRTNVECGAWLLGRGLRFYRGRGADDPVPFTLAEYNAGRSRVARWVAGAADRDRDAQKPGNQLTGDDLQAAIGFPGTKAYVEDVRARTRFYQQRGRL